MLKHIVMWKFKDEGCGRTKEENMAYAKENLLALKGKVPELIDIEAGTDVLHSPASFDMALICTFKDKDDMLAYQVNPEHKKVSGYIRLVVGERATADFYLD